MGLFNWGAPFIARFLGGHWRRPEAEQLARLLRSFVPSGGRLLDVGGGAGVVTVQLMGALGAEATILDRSPEMLARAPDHPRLHKVVGGAAGLPFASGSFDAVVVSDAFHHFGDLPQVVRELRRVVRPGGGIAISEVDPSGWRRLLVLVERILGEPAHFFAPAELCRFMALQGVSGRCFKLNSTIYLFVGEV